VVLPERAAVVPVRIRLLVAVLVGVAAWVVPVQMALSAPATRLAVLDAPGAAGGEDIDFPASHLGLSWTGSDDAHVQVRWQVDGRWGVWEDVPVAHDLEDHEHGIVYSGLLRVPEPGAARAQTRVLGTGARGVRVAAIDTERGPRHLVRVGSGTAGAAPGDAAGAPPQPPVVTRAQWGADESLRKATPPLFAPVTKLIVHHTVTTNLDPDPAATVRAIYSFHTQVRGWDDIGYNFLVDAQGRVYEGRRARDYEPGEVPTGEDLQGQGVVGAHAEGANTGSAGVALLGDFTSSMPTAAAMASLESWLAWKATRHEIDPLGSSLYKATDGTTSRFPNISGHRDVRATDCPGDRLYAALPALRQRVASAGSGVRTARGYWIAGADGTVYGLGAAPHLGDAKGLRLTKPIRGMAATPTQRGYWLLGGDGGIFAFGDAAFWGSTGAIRLNKPVVAMASTPGGKGYWLVASDGGIFAFGDAGFFGSAGAIALNKPVVGMAPTPTGKGYWLVASDGGVFAFGDARFAGSTGSIALNSPIVAMEPAADGSGYWMVARDGGVFAFGVPFDGSIPGLGLPSYAGSEALRATPAGLGYYVLAADGGMFTFGQAPFFGAEPGLSGAAAAVDMTVYDVPVALG